MKNLNLTKKDINNMITKDHTGKMTDMWTLSTNCRCNGYCMIYKDMPGCVCGDCFAQATVNQWNSLDIKLKRNTDILCNTIIDYDLIPVITKKDIFRFEAFGDLMNTTQFYNYYQFCIKNPAVTFALWTKNPHIIKTAFAKYGIEKPANLIIVYSEKFFNKTPSLGLPAVYDFIDKYFVVYTLDYLLKHGIDPDTFINCGARSCNKCRKCYNTGNDEIIIKELLKKDAKKWERMKEKFSDTKIVKGVK